MGKKKSEASLGRAIIRDRFGKSGRRERGHDSMRHTSDIEDGYNWGRLNLQSVTEQSNLDDFLTTAELAGTEFTAEKLNIKFVTSKITEGLLTSEERKEVTATQEKHRQLLSIPRRPKWDSNTTQEELEVRERESFLEWRRQLVELQEVEGILLTPFEKNLEFWRQLWRVIERSDVVVQIVDARNPLLFRCEDLEKYVVEVNKNKMNMILINKADFLTQEQREIWQDYFDSISLRVVFFSALQEFEPVEEDDKESNDSVDKSDEDCSSEDDTESLSRKLENTLPGHGSQYSSQLSNSSSELSSGKGKLCSREELIEIFKSLYKAEKVRDPITTIGLVGYPNVGKSSTINAILSHKKVSVSATPGKTKHFQTILVDDELCLCDCPGLVMPTFVSTKAEMVLNGILPIDQMRDHVGPINLVAFYIPRHILEETYGIIIPKPLEGEDETRQPTAEEVLNAYGYMRGFMTQRGLPDNPRASRYILKDYVNGKLLYSHAPPNVNQAEYHEFPQPKPRGSSMLTPLQTKISRANKVTAKQLDSSFFKQATSGYHLKSHTSGLKIVLEDMGSSTSSSLDVRAKPPKKHQNRKKREKLRRVHANLDE